MTDVIIHTSGDYTRRVDGEPVTVTAHAYHLVRADTDTDIAVTITVLPGRWLIGDARQDASRPAVDALAALVGHVAVLHGPLRLPETNDSAALRALTLRDAFSDIVEYGSAAAFNYDTMRHRHRRR